MKKISKILISNRGEIARRIIKTSKKMGITSIVVYSDADKYLPFVKEADEAYPLHGSESSLTYLNIEKIINIALENDVDAIHPGYGFLSENYLFAKQVIEKGIIFIGPNPDAILTMGDKVESRKKMKSIGIPVVPGYDDYSQDPDQLLSIAKEIGFPIMIKASAGGGGRGMRKVFFEKDFLSNLESAKREAKSFFSNDSVFIEKFIINPRHIEVQIFGDNHGNIIHLYDRDCSIQRRNQKIIEEAPAPNISDKTRQKIYDIAISAAKSINYSNAGTVEFVMDEREEFYFLEMNTRLQVEHPVTEFITNLDLVELQIKIAENRNIYDCLPNNKVPEKIGSAIELRICAEEGILNSKPATGKILFFDYRDSTNSRLDNGIEEGSIISTYYDSMISKLISYGESRDIAIQNALKNLNNLIILGIPTNHSLLNKILSHNHFRDFQINTGFIENHLKEEVIFGSEIDFILCSAFSISCIKIHDQANRAFHPIHYEGKELEKCYVIDTISLQEKIHLQYNNTIYSIHRSEGIFKIESNDTINSYTFPEIKILQKNLITFVTEKTIYFAKYGNKIFLHHNGDFFTVELLTDDSFSIKKSAIGISSSMPGKIISIHVKKGDKLSEGDAILSIESMKIENIIRADKDCEIDDILFSVGDQVSAEEPLVLLKKN